MDEKKLEETGKKLEKIGCFLTLVLTVPIVLTIFFGIPGLAIGIIIALITVIGALSKKQKPSEKTKNGNTNKQK